MIDRPFEKRIEEMKKKLAENKVLPKRVLVSKKTSKKCM